MEVYRVSRNPMYLGFYLVTLASLLSVPHSVNIGCGLVGIYVHHLIVLAEERFMQQEYTGEMMGSPFTGISFTGYGFAGKTVQIRP
jgi:hypothetical protein